MQQRFAAYGPLAALLPGAAVFALLMTAIYLRLPAPSADPVTGQSSDAAEQHGADAEAHRPSRQFCQQVLLLRACMQRSLPLSTVGFGSQKRIVDS